MAENHAPMPEPVTGKPDSSDLIETLDEILKQAQRRGKKEGADVVLDSPDDLRLEEKVRQVLERDKMRKRATELVEMEQRGARMEFRQALNPQAHIVADAKRAKTLAGRHNTHLIARDFVLNVLQYARTRGEHYAQNLEILRGRAHKYGFFIFPYTEEKMRTRIGNFYALGDDPIHPCYVIAEAGGQHPDPEKKDLHKGLWAADCHFHLPAPSPDAEPVVELPSRDTDEVYLDDWVEYLRQSPHAVASLDDIMCLQQMSHLGLASAAMKRGVEEIIQRINPNRPSVEIQSIGAAIAGLQGVRLPNGEEIRLGQGDLQHIVPILNSRSIDLFDYIRSDLFQPFETAYVLKNREYTVFKTKKGEGRYNIIVDWIVKVSPLKL